ncbi:MAG: hypothetical protein Q9199_005637 [Rusavskia elegans]
MGLLRKNAHGPIIFLVTFTRHFLSRLCLVSSNNTRFRLSNLGSGYLQICAIPITIGMTCRSNSCYNMHLDGLERAAVDWEGGCGVAEIWMERARRHLAPEMAFVSFAYSVQLGCSRLVGAPPQTPFSDSCQVREIT